MVTQTLVQVPTSILLENEQSLQPMPSITPELWEAAGVRLGLNRQWLLDGERVDFEWYPA
jgi:hypothetical protein